MDFFNQHGYETLNPAWPGDSPTVANVGLTRQPIANRGVREIADSYAKLSHHFLIHRLCIGHSFGGLIAQVILGRGIAAAGVAIDAGSD